MNDNIFGKRLKMLREEVGMSRPELAIHLNTSLSAISQYETGSRIPSDDIKISIAKLFGVSIDFLMGISEIRNPYIFFNLSELLKDLDEEEIKEVAKYAIFIKKFR